MLREPAHRPPGFSLVELLVVIGLLTLLIGLLLPVLANAQRSALEVKCQSNMRQVCASLLNYAAENKGKFPPNIEGNGTTREPQWWCDLARIGAYHRGSLAANSTPALSLKNTITGGVFACPADTDGSRSYSMNFWASSAAWVAGRVEAPNFPKAGQAWGAHTKQGDRLILLVEGLSHRSDGQRRHMSHPISPNLGSITNIEDLRFYPGIQFIGWGNLWGSGNDGRYWPTETELDWARHRRRGERASFYTEARGRNNFGFADGHVASFSADEVADRRTRKSTFRALWSPLDYLCEKLPRPNVP